MKFSFLAAIALVSMAAVLAACGGGVPAAEKSEVTPDSAQVVVVAGDPPLPSAKQAPEVKIGSSIGDRAPDFKVTFQDGSSVSREELAAEGRPAFLFFMATW